MPCRLSNQQLFEVHLSRVARPSHYRFAVWHLIVAANLRKRFAVGQAIAYRFEDFVAES
jgi:hypothetical protein